MQGNPYMQEAERLGNVYRATRRKTNTQGGTSTAFSTLKAHQCLLTFDRDLKKSGDPHFHGVTELARMLLCPPSKEPA
jgi:hypothetical protein